MDHQQMATTCLQRPTILIFVTKRQLLIMIICHQWPHIWGPEYGRCTQVWDYTVVNFVNILRAALKATFFCQKNMCKMLMKLTLGVNFINVLWAAFTWADPKSAKKTDSLTVFFVLLGSARVNVGEIDPWTPRAGVSRLIF